MAGSRNTETLSPKRPTDIRPAGQCPDPQTLDFIDTYAPKPQPFLRVEWNGTKPATYVFKNSMNDPVRRDEKGTPVDDDSAVRERSAPPPARASRPPTSASTSVGAPHERLEQKLRHGRSVLASLPAGDDRARLLHVAIMRRDESLLMMAT